MPPAPLNTLISSGCATIPSVTNSSSKSSSLSLKISITSALPTPLPPTLSVLAYPTHLSIVISARLPTPAKALAASALPPAATILAGINVSFFLRFLAENLPPLILNLC